MSPTLVTVPVHASCHDVQRVLAAVATNGLPPSYGLQNTGQLLWVSTRTRGGIWYILHQRLTLALDRSMASSQINGKKA